VKCIYIDPPYNTGQSEIDYINRFKDSSWLSLLENRLSISKDFLSENGILCMTIGHTELHNARNLISQIFGEANVLGLVSIKNNPSGRSTVKGFSLANEYAIFATRTEKNAIGMLPRTEGQLAQYDQEDEKGRFQWRNFLRAGGANDFRTARPRLFYPLIVSDNNVRIPKLDWDNATNSWILEEKPVTGERVVYPISNGIEYTWRVGVESLQNRLTDVRVRYSRRGEPIIEIKFRPDNEGVLPKTIWDNKLYNATAYGTSLLRDIIGRPQSFSFPKSVYAVADSIRVCTSDRNACVLDFFAGSGTTAHAVINLNRQDGGRRKYILVEMADYFDTVLLPRIKKVVFSDDWKDGKAQNGQGISHFVKYYQLEQYEDVLRRAKYEDANLFENPYEDPYHQYIFLRDPKMLEALEVDLQNNKVKVDLSKLYDSIDIAETLSCLTGKWIKRLNSHSVEFEDGEDVDLKNLDWRLIKPLIWW
jgi:adenine-specific DNA-methyltransferase